MSVEVLRHAAALMRERAEAATLGPWEAWSGSDAGGGEYVSSTTDRHGMVADTWNGYDDPAVANAEHIASWHPAVALAVADLLDAVAADFDIAQYGYWSERALAVARAYVGDQP